VDYATIPHGFNPEAADKPAQNQEFVADLDTYHRDYAPLRSDSVLLGIEIGLTAYYLPLNRQTALAYGYDYILGAVHSVDGYDMYHDGRNRFTYDRKRRMLTYSLEMVQGSGDFIDAFGHIDYITRYTPEREKLVRYSQYPGEYDALLQELAQRDIALEINTSRFGNPGLETNLLQVYKRFYALGGRHVTIGSDAHRPGDLARHHRRALAMAEEAKLTTVFFKKRKRYVCG
jgi:histidinol-phosphatase (PHP family)